MNQKPPSGRVKSSSFRKTLQQVEDAEGTPSPLFNSLSPKIQGELGQIQKSSARPSSEAEGFASERSHMHEFSKLCEKTLSPPCSTKNTDKRTPKSQKSPHEISTMGQLLPLSNMADLYKGTFGTLSALDEKTKSLLMELDFKKTSKREGSLNVLRKGTNGSQKNFSETQSIKSTATTTGNKKQGGLAKGTSNELQSVAQSTQGSFSNFHGPSAHSNQKIKENIRSYKQSLEKVKKNIGLTKEHPPSHNVKLSHPETPKNNIEKYLSSKKPQACLSFKEKGETISLKSKTRLINPKGTSNTEAKQPSQIQRTSIEFGSKHPKTPSTDFSSPNSKQQQPLFSDTNPVSLDLESFSDVNLEHYDSVYSQIRSLIKTHGNDPANQEFITQNVKELMQHMNTTYQSFLAMEIDKQT